MPDIDVDFCFERRDEVLAYVRQKYGDDRVAQIITFGTIKGKQAIRDVGRVLGLSFAETDRIVKLYPRPSRAAIFRSRTRSRWSRGCATERDKYPELFEYAFKLEGLLRHASRHAAGVVIADAAAGRYWCRSTSTRSAARTAVSITQYSMKGVEEIGLIKFDFLALKNLTLIHDTLDLIARRRQDSARPEPAQSRRSRKATSCSRAATPSACSRWKARGCAASSPNSSPPASRT